MPGARCEVPGFRYQVSGATCLVQGDLVKAVPEGAEGGAKIRETLGDKQLERSQLGANIHHLKFPVVRGCCNMSSAR